MRENCFQGMNVKINTTISTQKQYRGLKRVGGGKGKGGGAWLKKDEHEIPTRCIYKNMKTVKQRVYGNES